MNTASSGETRFDALVACWLDGVITDAEIAELNILIRKDSRRLDSFARSVFLQHSIREIISVDKKEFPSTRNATPKRRLTLLRKRFFLPLSFAVIACLLVILSQHVQLRFTPSFTSADNNSSNSVTIKTALLSQSMNSEWHSSGKRWSVGDRIGVGDTLLLKAGRVELIFDNKAILALLGPAKLKISGADFVSLSTGTATVRVDGKKGQTFRVKTPNSNVVDLGTEFGVRVNAKNETEVVVFDGAVDLEPAPLQFDGPTHSRRLLIGEGARVRNDGKYEPVVSIDDDAFPFGDRLFPRLKNRPAVITKVTDNRRDPKESRFYRIYRECLADDARSYVDRPYEWNGVTQEGIPYYLRGADYVATFNDDKLDGPLIEVTLACPSWLYVIYDDRLIVPEWLSAEFENTGDKVGLDGGFQPPDSYFIGVGPGVSINAEFSVWKKRVEQPGTVRLGRLSRRKIGGGGEAMFGIAAQPIQ